MILLAHALAISLENREACARAYDIAEHRPYDSQQGDEFGLALGHFERGHGQHGGKRGHRNEYRQDDREGSRVFHGPNRTTNPKGRRQSGAPVLLPAFRGACVPIGLIKGYS